MEEDQLNDLAALLGTGLSDSERGRMAAGVLSVPEARRLLFAASFPGFKESLMPEAPFEIAGSLSLGVWGPYFRILDIEGLTLTRGSGRLATALKTVSLGNLPSCLKGRLECEAPLGREKSSFHLVLKNDGDRIRLSLAPLGASAGRIEIWKDGELIRNLPVENLAKRPVTDNKPGSNISIRLEGSATGASIVLVPIEFGRKERLAAGIVNVLCGNLSDAFDLFSKLESSTESGEGIGEKIRSWIRGIGAVARLDEGSLLPASSLRSVETNPDERLSVFHPVWEGILASWPEAAHLPNPWGSPPVTDKGRETSLPTSVLALAQATNDAALGSTPSAFLDAPGAPSEQPVLEGWAALEGWGLLAERNYEAAFEKFSTIPAVGENDPFGLKLGSKLAEHLMKSETLGRSERDQSGDQVWRGVFEGIL